MLEEFTNKHKTGLLIFGLRLREIESFSILNLTLLYAPRKVSLNSKSEL